MVFSSCKNTCTEDCMLLHEARKVARSQSCATNSGAIPACRNRDGNRSDQRADRSSVVRLSTHPHCFCAPLLPSNTRDLHTKFYRPRIGRYSEGSTLETPPIASDKSPQPLIVVLCFVVAIPQTCPACPGSADL